MVGTRRTLYQRLSLFNRLQMLAFEAELGLTIPDLSLSATSPGSGVLDCDGLQLVRHVLAGVERVFELVV